MDLGQHFLENARFEFGRLKRLAERAMEQRQLGLPATVGLAEAMQQVKQFSEGPIVLVEPADNIGGGAPGAGVPEHRCISTTTSVDPPAAL